MPPPVVLLLKYFPISKEVWKEIGQILFITFPMISRLAIYWRFIFLKRKKRWLQKVARWYKWFSAHGSHVIRIYDLEFIVIGINLHSSILDFLSWLHFPIDDALIKRPTVVQSEETKRL